MPFTAMISSLCTTAEALFSIDNLIIPPIGPITFTLVKKSIAMSHTPSQTMATSSEAPPKPKQGFWKKKIMDFMKKIDKKLDFCINVEEQKSRIKYVEDSDEKESGEDKEGNEVKEDDESE